MLISLSAYFLPASNRAFKDLQFEIRNRFVSALLQEGTFTTISDKLTIYIAGRDERDATSADVPVGNFAAECGREVKGLRVGIPREYFGEGLDPEIRQAIERRIDGLRASGCEIVNVSLPHTEYAVAAYYVIAPSEASANLARYDGVRFGHRSTDPGDLFDLYTRSRDEGFGAEVKRRIMLGTYALSAGYYDAYYVKAQQVRTLIKAEFDAVLGELLPAADVVVESGPLRRLRTLSRPRAAPEAWSHAAHVAATPFGTWGPRRAWRAGDRGVATTPLGEATRAGSEPPAGSPQQRPDAPRGQLNPGAADVATAAPATQVGGAIDDLSATLAAGPTGRGA